MAAHRRRRCLAAGGEAGFTLIELAVALVLVGLVSAILLQGIRLAVAGLEGTSRHADRLDQRRGMESALRRYLAAAALVPTADGQPAFSGGPARLSFLTIAEDAGAGVYRIELALRGAGRDRRLVMVRRPAEGAADGRRHETVLAAHVRSFALAYYGTPDPAETPGWREAWQGIVYLPRLVRVALDSGDGLARPPLVIRLWNGG